MMNGDDDDPHHTSWFNQAGRFGPIIAIVEQSCNTTVVLQLIIVQLLKLFESGQNIMSGELVYKSSLLWWMGSEGERRELDRSKIES